MPAPARLSMTWWLPLALLWAGCADAPCPDQGAEKLLSWERLPELGASRYRQFSSHDRLRKVYTPVVDLGNKDFNNFITACGDRPMLALEELDDALPCDPGIEGYLIASDDRGPGSVSRIWLTAFDLLAGKFFADEVIRIYVDDLTDPVYTGKINDWVTETDEATFVKPLAGWWSGAVVSYVPISYRSRLRILLDNLETAKMYYYQVDIQNDGCTQPFQPSRFNPSSVEAMANRIRTQARQPEDALTLLDEDRLLSAGQDTLLLDHQGRGTIHRLEFSFPVSAHADLQALSFYLAWDEEEQPSVDVPLCAFFGCSQTLASFETLPLSCTVEGDKARFSLFLPMPFRSRMRMGLRNAGARDLHAQILVMASTRLPPGDWGFFHAAYQRQEAPMGEGAHYLVADLSGRGTYVGTMMLMTGTTNPKSPGSDPMNFLEGDETGMVDGLLAIPGTGTEDYFNGGFYFGDGPYSQDFSALIYINRNLDTKIGQVSAVRWHVLSDAIHFQDQFTLSFEFGANLPELALDYSSIAFYYQP